MNEVIHYLSQFLPPDWAIRQNAISYNQIIHMQSNINSALKLNLNADKTQTSQYWRNNTAAFQSSYHKTQVSCQPLHIHSSAPAHLSNTTPWYTRHTHKHTSQRTQREDSNEKNEQWHKYTKYGCFEVDCFLWIRSEFPEVYYINKLSPPEMINKMLKY